jgi:CYTH domain-containing protein
MGDASADWWRSPGQGRYARAEIERRFLVNGEVDSLGEGRLIEDRYLDGLRLRLRRVTKDGRSVFKLTQKVRANESDPATVSITNVYLSPDEYDRMRALPGADIVKTRRLAPYGPVTFAVDEFGASLKGLVTTEVEVISLLDPLEAPAWVGREITSDDRFSGGRLARANSQEIEELLTIATRNHP